MVLLTSSAVSAVISAGVVCLFTFLLFLSGYVLQQQTVRSLQEALRKPPEPKPVPTIPASFQSEGNETGEVVSERINHVVVVGGSGTEVEAETRESQDVVGLKPTTASLQYEQEHVAQIGNAPELDQETTLSAITEAVEQQTLESLAYILSLPNPSDLCSAILFAKRQRQYTNLQSPPSIMVLYPTTWETSGAPHHISALTFMRDVQDEFDLTYHPVNIKSVWSGVGVNAHLLGELQRIRWDYDRAMYLKTPGLAVDTVALDRALATSNVKTSWSPLSASAGDDPEMMLYTRKKGLMMARGEMRKLAATALTNHADHHANEMDVEAAAKNAAYVLFDEVDLEHRRNEKEWYGGVFERFERERRDICKGRGLLSGDEDKWDLRR